MGVNGWIFGMVLGEQEPIRGEVHISFLFSLVEKQERNGWKPFVFFFNNLEHERNEGGVLVFS